MHNDLIYKIGLTLIPGIGDVLAKNLIAYCGSAEAIFKEKKQALLKIPGIGTVNASAIKNQNVLARAEEEIKFIEKYNITPLFFTDTAYPHRLKQCDDGPVMLYYKGNVDLNAAKIISVVGTRSATDYGKQLCEQFIDDIKNSEVLIISGLAYGIDVCAHRACIKNNIPTIGVLAHGLDAIYPPSHATTAKKMLTYGGLLTDFMSNTNPDKENFPKRNRIVAGMADVTVVIESKKEGGSLITADIANSYNRDVFAFPGRVNDPHSEGCNMLIKNHKAALISSAADVLHLMGWDENEKKTDNKQQQQLFVELNKEEEVLVNILKQKGNVPIDELCFSSQLSMSKVSSLLLNLEFSNVVKSLPGKIYTLN